MNARHQFTDYDAIIDLAFKNVLQDDTKQLIRTQLKAIDTVSPEMLQLAYLHMTTGSETARSSAARSLELVLDGISRLTRTNRPGSAEEDAYREVLSYNDGLLLLEDQMKLSWHFHNVCSETGIAPTKQELIASCAISKFSSGFPSGEDPDTYWRGVAALYIVLWDITSVPDVDAHADFIREAAASDDIAGLVNLAHERGILSVNKLRSLMEEQDHIQSGLRTGVL